MVKRLMPILSVVLLFAATQVHALSLGDITLESAVGEPLQASIQLLDSEGLSVSDISAMVASATDFQRFGAERIAALDNLSINVEYVDGAPVLRVSSPVTLDEPFLSLVLDTRWPAGRALTEYTLRLESPAFSAQSNQQISAAPVQSVFEPVPTGSDTDTGAEPDSDSAPDASEQPAVASVAQTDAATDNTTTNATGIAPAAADGQSDQAPAPQPAPVADADDLANASTLTVNAGDTMWELALRARPDDSVSVQQTMLALQRLNPDAFLADNINSVKRGEVLRVPELNEIRRLAADDAIVEVMRQNRESQQPGANTLGREPVTAGPGAATPGSEQGQLRVVTADDDSEETADASASAASAQSAEQEIVRNDEQLETLEDSLALREEELDRLDLENTELNSRLSMLQQQIASAQEIVRLRDLELAQLQDQLAEAEPAASASEEQTTTITMAPDAGPVERFFNMLISNTWALLAVAAVLVLLLVLVLMRRNRAAMTDEQRAQHENDAMPLGDDSDDELLFSGVAAAAAAAESDETKADDAATGSAQAGDDQNSDAVTYGATGALDDGIADGGTLDDSDWDESVTDDDAFADTSPDASALDDNISDDNTSDDNTSDEDTVLDDEFALDDTLEVDPVADNAFTGAAVSGVAAGQTSDTGDDADEGPDWGDIDLDLDDEDTVGADNEAGEFKDRNADAKSDDDELFWPDAETVGVATDDAEYDIYDETGEKTAAPAPESSASESPAPEPGPAPAGSDQQDDQDNDQDDNKNEDMAVDDLDDLAFISNEDSFDADDEDDDDEDFAFLSDSDEAATKLDLARAYIDMGDSDGAREILAEVVKEGTEAQRLDAESLLEKL